MKKKKIETYKFEELSLETKRKLLNKKLLQSFIPLSVATDIIETKFKELGFNIIKIKVKTDPLILEGSFHDGLYKYLITKENDSTKFYSNKNVREGNYLVSLKEGNNSFIQAYLKVFKETKELLYIIRNTLEDYYFEELMSYDKEVYLKDGTLIKSDTEEGD